MKLCKKVFGEILKFSLVRVFVYLLFLPILCHGLDKKFEAKVLAELSRLENKMSNQIEELKVKIDEKDRRIERLEEKLAAKDKEKADIRQQKRNPGYVPESEVGFSARVSQHLTNLAANQRIVFGTLVSNIGNYYNNLTGIFYAPVSGTYMFYVNILAEPGHYIETELLANGNLLAEIYSGGAVKYDGPGSNLVIVHLAQGDQVWVKVHVAYSSNMAVHCCWSTFSGYLLREGTIAGPGTIVG